LIAAAPHLTAACGALRKQTSVTPAVTSESSAVTRPVNGIAAGSHITQLSAGGGHVLALRSDSTVLAWGANEYGQLGNGTTASSGPGLVTGLTGATQVSAGFISSYAVHTVPYLVGL
jgi:alpha-tubulin suppressor-like RCC1 family protein